MSEFTMARRGIFRGGMAGGLMLATLPSRLLAQDDTPTTAIETRDGKIRGLRSGDVSRFLGIPYGADTGKTRFMPARPPEPWTAARDCFAYGDSAPPGRLSVGGGASESMKMLGWLMGAPGEVPPPTSEDCLFLNLWTPDPSPQRKRPVMFWLHGGGFAQGSGSSQAYDGSALCNRGDVVVVTINHRLSALGYLYLARIIHQTSYLALTDVV